MSFDSMNFKPMINIPAGVTEQLQARNNEREILVNASFIQTESTAEKVAENIYKAVIAYQNSLPDPNDVALKVVQFNESTIIMVDSIGYIGYNLVKFVGQDNSGNPVELIQHVSQLNFLLMVVPKPVPTDPKRPIGFQASVV